jgi:hypothetical protein
MSRLLAFSFGLLIALNYANAATNSTNCISSGNQDTINNALRSGGAGAQVQLCQGAVIGISNTIKFTADNQEISTQGYPTSDTRATIQLKPGTTANILIDGGNRNGIRILNLQVDGNRPNTGYQQGSYLDKFLREAGIRSN